MTESAAGGVVPPASAGAQLRAAREKQGVHLGVLASAIKVAPRKLEMLESDRIDQLPDASFARALALSMCRALKIDPEPVLAQLPQPAAPGLVEMARGLDQPFREREARRQDDGGSRLPSLPVLGALLLGIGALVVYFLPAGGGWSPAALVGAPAASAVVTEAPASAAEPVAADPVPVPVPEAAASVAAPVEPSAATASSPQSAAAVDAAAGLSVRARADSWVEVTGAGERVLFSRIVAAGETVHVDAAPPLRVTVGNAGATELLFRGQPVPLEPNRDNIARVELK